jgi:propanediol dehydratase large subunit
MGRARVAGDYLQTAAIFDERMNVLSKVTDPNDYQGPGTGYAVSPARRDEMVGIRQQRSRQDYLARQAAAALGAAESAGGGAAASAAVPRFVERGEAQTGADPREVCVGVSPAFATRLWLTMSGLPVGEALRQIVAGIEEEGCTARLVRVRSSFDLGVIGLTAAQLAGSGIGVGLQAKGTAVINRRDLPPLACLELLSIAPVLTRDLYHDLGVNAARYAKWLQPEPLRNPYTDQAIEGRYHAEVVALVAVEREACVPNGMPVNLEVDE